MFQDIVINPIGTASNIEVRSDERVVLLDGQPFRLPKELVENLAQVVEALAFAKGS